MCARENISGPPSDRLGPLTHDLLHAVAVLNAYAVTLDGQWSELDEDARRELAGWIRRQTEKLRDLMAETAAAIRMESTALGDRSHEPRHAVDLAREALDTLTATADIVLRVDAGAEGMWIECDGPQIVRLLGNLLKHAVRIGGTGP